MKWKPENQLRRYHNFSRVRHPTPKITPQLNQKMSEPIEARVSRLQRLYEEMLNMHARSANAHLDTQKIYATMLQAETQRGALVLSLLKLVSSPSIDGANRQPIIDQIARLETIDETLSAMLATAKGKIDSTSPIPLPYPPPDSGA